MVDPAPRHVALVGHRLAAAAPTGIGRYYIEIASGLARVADPRRFRYTVASTRERARPTWVAPPLGLGTLGGPRKPRALAWGLVRRPHVDRALGYPDLVHVLQPWAPVPSRVPVVATIHDLMPVLHPDWYGRMESWSYGRAMGFLRDEAAVVVASSQWTADLVSQHVGIAPDRIRVVWLGAGDEFRRRPTPDEVDRTCARHGVEPGRYLVTVGTVSTRKNLPVVLRALARIDPALLGPTALVAAGPPGVGAAEIDDEVARLGLRDRVRFAGFVASEELPVLVGASLALVHPSRDEGFGITPIEAMAAGVPALASDAGSLPEATGGAAVLLGPDDADGWAAAITAVATDADHRAALVAAGDRHQARVTWTQAAVETMAVHAELLGAPA